MTRWRIGLPVVAVGILAAASAFVGAQHWNGGRVIPAEDHRQRAGLEDFAHRLLGALNVILEVVHVAGHVTAIDGRKVASSPRR